MIKKVLKELNYKIVKESTTTASTSSSGPQNSGVSGSNYSQESKRSGSSR